VVHEWWPTRGHGNTLADPIKLIHVSRSISAKAPSRHIDQGIKQCNLNVWACGVNQIGQTVEHFPYGVILPFYLLKWKVRPGPYIE
jgi:hypothetical protein